MTCTAGTTRKREHRQWAERRARRRKQRHRQREQRRDDQRHRHQRDQPRRPCDHHAGLRIRSRRDGADDDRHGRERRCNTASGTIRSSSTTIQTLTINANASVIASGPQTTEEAINPIGAGNAIINRGLIKAGASSAIFFENVGTTAASPRNSVDNFGTIDARGGTNPTTGGEAIGSFHDVGIDITNETGAFIYGNLDLQGGNDIVTLRTGSTITGNLNGGGGTNLLNLDAVAGASDSLPGVVQNFQTLNKTGAGTWTLTGSVGQSSGAPLVMNVVGGTLVLTGNNASFNGTRHHRPRRDTRGPRPEPAADNRRSERRSPDQPGAPDGIQPNDGTYAGHIIGSGIVTKIGVGTVTLTGDEYVFRGHHFRRRARSPQARIPPSAPRRVR